MKCNKITIQQENKSYFLINVISILLIALIFLWTIFNPIPISCVYKEMGIACKTCGLTRAFKAILTADFSNPIINFTFLKIFLFFFTQFINRVILSYYLLKGKLSPNFFIYDSIITVLCFSYTFYELLPFFNEMT